MDTRLKRRVRSDRGKTRHDRPLRFDRLEERTLLATAGLVDPLTSVEALPVQVSPTSPGGAGQSTPEVTPPGQPGSAPPG